MIVDIYYAVGDNVSYNHKTGELTEETCGFCDGKGTITGHDNTVIDCPICNGKGTLEFDNREEEKLTGTIQEARVLWYRNSGTAPRVEYLIETALINQNDVISRV